jgi:toxin ParE1/3/4
MLLIYSRLAEEDVVEIARYTFQVWGLEQTEKYLSQLEDCCRMIAQNPNLGRHWNGVPRGLRRIEHGKHVIFYRPLDSSIVIARILHHSMLPNHCTFDQT